MKMYSKHYAHMENEINKFFNNVYPVDALVKKYEYGDFPRSDKVKDLQRRFCFDLLRYAGLIVYVCDELYGYLNDDHIYTALKRICPKVTRKY